MQNANQNIYIRSVASVQLPVTEFASDKHKQLIKEQLLLLFWSHLFAHLKCFLGIHERVLSPFIGLSHLNRITFIWTISW